MLLSTDIYIYNTLNIFLPYKSLFWGYATPLVTLNSLPHPTTHKCGTVLHNTNEAKKGRENYKRVSNKQIYITKCAETLDIPLSSITMPILFTLIITLYQNTIYDDVMMRSNLLLIVFLSFRNLQSQSCQ